MGFFVVPVAFTRSVFRPSDAARLPIPQLRGYSILAATTPPCFAHPGAAFPRSDNSARSRNPDRAQTRAGTRTSAARSRFRPPRPVRRSSRLRLRRQSLHTATTRQPVTSNPITARKAVASPAATATDQTRPDQTRAGTRTERWTSAAHSRFRPPRPVRQSSRLRLRRQPLHTATIRRPVTSCPITARKAVASPTATAPTRPEPSRNPDRTPDWSRTSAARSRSRYPQPVRQSFRLRLRRQSLHTATIRRPVTSNPITARKAVASPEATAQTRAGTPTERRTIL